MFLLEELPGHMAGLENDTAGDMEVCTGSGCRNLQQVQEGYGRWGRRGYRFPGMFNHGFHGRMYGGSVMG